ncbi:LysR family transcriptional regulator [Corynebacterium uropygiale]|uniref:LysR family transcriptional regulator n=1 Tax=Corynebacterium uropygiale TaxID=1775911 RepID=UPI0022A78DEF|nr:LysR family transcriptional regulator [Corynebacterium uropygiale]
MAKRVDTAHLEALVTFLAVARLGHYVAAAQYLGVNHTTVSRRIHDLEKALGGPLLVRAKNGWELSALGERTLSLAEQAEEVLHGLGSLRLDDAAPLLRGLVRIAAPDVFSVHVITPAMAALHKDHPELDIELITATQRARQGRSGMDIEVVVGKPQVLNSVTRPVMDYHLRLYASRDYVAEHGEPRSMKELEGHPINFYVESGLQVDDLDSGRQSLPEQKEGPKGIASTSVFGHVSATIHGAGIGLLPDYLAGQHDFVPILPEDYRHPVSYWVVVRKENTRNPRVRACLRAIEQRVAHMGAGTAHPHHP